MDNAICITDKDGTLRYTNPAANELFRVPPEFEPGKKIWDYIPIIKPNDEIIQLFINGITNKTSTQQSLVEFVNIDKKYFRLWINLTYVEEDKGKFVIDINDMTLFLKVSDAFERYTSPQIADYVLNTPKGEKQGGISREVTVLMSDLRGFTAISASMEPSRLIKSLNHYFEKMVAVIEKYGGTVIEFLGDGIFVVFGAPNEDKDHAAKAVACAIEMQNVLYSINEKSRKKNNPEFEMGIGINSGPAIVGNIGSKQKMKYGVMGYSVNLAGRVEGYTTGGQIMITEDTKAMIQDDLLIREVQTILPKGGNDKLNLYDVIGIGKNHILKQSSQNILWRELSEPKKLKIYLLDGKIVQDTPHTVTLTAVSDNGHYAKLHTRLKLKVSDNMMIRSGLTMYAKVIGKEENDYLISFTMRPDGFTDWINSL